MEIQGFWQKKISLNGEQDIKSFLRRYADVFNDSASSSVTAGCGGLGVNLVKEISEVMKFTEP
jgi:hypothetical protein